VTDDQQIRAWAAMAVFGQGKNPILMLSLNGREASMELSSHDELRAVEAYIRDGLESPDT
jgi:hypothetical protein